MRLTQHTDYSLRVLMYLALQGDERSTIAEITEAYGISRNHLMKVVQKLSRMGYVDSTRGSKGGLRLNRAPENIHLGQVVKDMEPDLGLVECFRTELSCVIEPACVLPAIMDRALEAFMAELDKKTVADLVGKESANSLVRILKIQK
jgi:Rrf2 family nitric oxide-sensitive transcriptional repressor